MRITRIILPGFDNRPFIFDGYPESGSVEKREPGNESISRLQAGGLILCSKPANMNALKSVISTLLLITALLTAKPVTMLAQTDTEGTAVKACLENYLSGDGNRMENAFHPSATMKYIDFQSGEFKDVPIADFIARVKSNTNKTERKTEIVSMNIEGNAAQAKIRIETDKVIMNDYMNLLKVNGEWKIVSKIFSRQNK
jgi:hypothetical protein